jgi:cyclic pyranopterin phosphate synthase
MEKLSNLGFKPEQMSLKDFKIVANKIKEFPQKLKRLCLIRHGEALLNRELPEIIKYAKSLDIAEKINISTNGSLLNEEINHKLIDSGIDEILISIEGITSEKYKEITGVEVDFDKLVKNIKHLHSIKKDCVVNVKTVDVSLDAHGEDEFYHIFNEIADNACVEHIIPCFSNVDYENIKDDYSLNIIGNEYKEILVCPQPFFQMHIFPNGNISVCNADYDEKIVIGNAFLDSLVETWNSDKLNEFRLMQIKGNRYEHNKCKECNGSVCYTSDSDILDDKKVELEKVFMRD